MANHVIFFAPYLTSGSNGQRKWAAAMEQARGRAVRFGQLKEVKISHFFAAHTFEIDLFEHRTGKILEQGSSEYEAVLREPRPEQIKGPFSSAIGHRIPDMFD